VSGAWEAECRPVLGKAGQDVGVIPELAMFRQSVAQPDVAREQGLPGRKIRSPRNGARAVQVAAKVWPAVDGFEDRL